MPTKPKLKIVVLGYIVRGPLGGLVWHHLQYVLGLRRLGHEVLFLEDSEDYEACYHPPTDAMTADPAYGLAFLQETFRYFDLHERWAYYDAHTHTWYGWPHAAVEAFCRSADLLLNLSGVTPLREWSARVPLRAFIDTDPAFTQIRHLTHAPARQEAAAYQLFFTFGERFGQPDCGIPDDGFLWQPTRQPVVLDAWPVAPGDPAAPWTTVMQWDSYRERTYDGRRYGMKSASFADYADLPGHTNEVLELALGSATAPREALRQSGWRLRDPLRVTRSARSYQAFLQGSKGEWSIAKQGYVESRSGWFSERSAAYLASGRPVVVQDTGFSDFLATGSGLLAFTTPREALDALQRVQLDYRTHCRSAREAVRAFAAETVLPHLLERSTTTPLPSSFTA